MKVILELLSIDKRVLTDKKYEWKYFDTEIFSRTCNYYEWLLSADNGDVTCDYVTETIKIFNIVYRCL